MVSRGCSRSVERVKAQFGVGPQNVASRYRTRDYDNYRNSIILHTPFLRREYVLELHNVLRGAMVL